MRLPQSNLRRRLPTVMIGLLLCVGTSPVWAGVHSGEKIYHDQCARCHGVKGEGTEDNYPDPLEGDKSVAQLTSYIHKSMPDDLDTKLPADEAAKVAAYIYDAFYSPEARVRNKPARVELSRLTVRQYQNAVADLVGSFRSPANWGNERGLRGEYSQSRYVGEGKKHFERTDPEVDFDFGDGSPDSKELDAKEFSVRWHGSVYAPDTGDYDFVIRTQHSARLFVNDMETPLVDAWVKSGDDPEHRATIRLLGGRAYPIRLEFSKANQGVNDKDQHKRHPPPKKAFISLSWKRPNHTLSVIPSRDLSVKDSPEVFVVQAHFPPDDRSVG
ncbi:MAG TPA: PA14 domain-containing protein, partial [Lacipirellulaceae bacterium]|nr:PA14 domain-containing protein [Lacipirellulaceae bacterium]